VKVVADWLGHSSAKLTLDTYGHLLEGMDREAASVMEAALAAVRA
jgi:integrase